MIAYGFRYRSFQRPQEIQLSFVEVQIDRILSYSEDKQARLERVLAEMDSLKQGN